MARGIYLSWRVLDFSSHAFIDLYWRVLDTSWNVLISSSITGTENKEYVKKQQTSVAVVFRDKLISRLFVKRTKYLATVIYKTQIPDIAKYVEVRPRKACNYWSCEKLAGFRRIRLALSIRDGRELQRRHVPPFSGAIRGFDGM